MNSTPTVPVASALAVGLAAALLLPGCDAPATPGATPSEAAGSSPASSAGQAVDDAVLSTRVKSALLAESRVSGGDISVSTEQGQVTLSGRVPREQIGRAATIARKVPGVRKVVNALVPASPS